MPTHKLQRNTLHVLVYKLGKKINVTMDQLTTGK